MIGAPEAPGAVELRPGLTLRIGVLGVSLMFCGNGVSLDEPPHAATSPQASIPSTKSNENRAEVIGFVENRGSLPAMNVRLVHEFRFEAAHRLPRVPVGHKCARLHGHSFKVELAIEGPMNPDTGWFIDFGDLYKIWQPIHDQIDHNYLNEIEGLENPTSEVLVHWLWEKLRPTLPSLTQVTLWETCEARCEYRGG